MLKHQVSATLQRHADRKQRTIFEDRSSTSSSDTSKNGSGIESSSSPTCTSSQSLSCYPRPSSSALRLRARSSSISSLSSAGSSCESSIDWGTLKVHTQTIRTDTDYKTFFINTTTTAEDVIRMVLSKFKLAYRDPKLFYLTMEVRTKLGGVDVVNEMELDDSSRPLELQSCHPRDKSKIVLKMHPGAPVKIYDYFLSNNSNYKSVMVSKKTTCSEAVGLMLQSLRLQSSSDNFLLVCVDTRTGYEFVLPPNASLLAITEQSDETQQIHIRAFQCSSKFTQRARFQPVLEDMGTQFDSLAI